MVKKLEQNTEELRFTVPAKLFGYLTLLARDTMLGANPNEVALSLLTREAERCMIDGYHSRVVPTAASVSEQE